MCHRPWRWLALFLCGWGLLALAGAEQTGPGGVGRPFTLLPERVFFRIAADEARFIEQELARGKPDTKTARAVKAAAWRVAASAEVALTSRGKFPPKFTTLATLGLHNIRHDAIALVAAVDAGDFDRARKLVAHLTPGYPKPNVAVKIDAKSVAKRVPFRDVMFLFSSGKVGGAEVEALLDELAAKKKLSKADLARLEVVGYKVAVLAQLADHYTPGKDQGARTAKAWRANTAAFRTASTELAKAAGDGKEEEARMRLRSLRMACRQCHETFRQGE
jgi:hypothetical protein